jgi:capsular polysaccharide biosynthesis protein
VIRSIILRLLESYFRHRWLYLLPIGLMAAAMALYIVLVPAPYTAEGTLYVQQETLLSSLTSVRSSGFGFRYVTPSEETVGELYQLMNSDGFMRAVVGQTDLEARMNEGPRVIEETLREAREAVWFHGLGNNLVAINATFTMPRVAAQLVEATIETYTLWKTNISRDESAAAQTFFADLVTTYRTELDAERNTLTTYLVTHPEPVRGNRPPEEAATIAKLTAAVELAEERLRNAENKEEDAQLAVAQTESNIRQSYFVVDAPQVPTEPKRSKKELAMVLALFLAVGGIMSVTGIVGGALLDRSLRFPVDVKQSLQLPVLALIPESAPRYVRNSTGSSAARHHGYVQPRTALLPLKNIERPARNNQGDSAPTPRTIDEVTSEVQNGNGHERRPAFQELSRN